MQPSNPAIPSTQLLGRFYATAAGSASAAKPRAKKTASKTTSKKSSSRPAKKAAVKPTPKPKKVLTEKQIAARAATKAKAELKELKETALLTEPKGLPKTAWQVLLQQGLQDKKSEIGKTHPMTSFVAELAAQYKSMDASAREVSIFKSTAEALY